jgi:hypothetical protein
MLLSAVFRTIAARSAPILSIAVALLFPVAGHADGLAATATIASTPNGSSFHYDMTLTNTGTTTVGTFWFAWLPSGAFFLPGTPVNVTSPAGWTAVALPYAGNYSIEWTATAPVAPGTTVTGFSFDTTVTPDQMTGASMVPGDPVDTSYVYIDGPGGSDPGLLVVPSAGNALPIAAMAASILPGGRSVAVGTAATVFATMVNAGSTDIPNCQISLPQAAPAGLTMSYQTTDPITNALTGTPDQAFTVPAYMAQSFLLSFKSDAALAAPGLPLVFGCDGYQPVGTIPGVNSIDLLFSATPIADVIAIAATAASSPGIVQVPQSTGGSAAFAVASANVGTADSLTVSADTGEAVLPLSLFLCETNPANGTCLAPPAASVTLTDAAGATPTFSVFATASAPINFDPAGSRIFVRFKDPNGTSHGSTSVAVETN